MLPFPIFELLKKNLTKIFSALKGQKLTEIATPNKNLGYAYIYVRFNDSYTVSHGCKVCILPTQCLYKIVNNIS